MSSKSNYPWFFFYRIARLALIISLPIFLFIVYQLAGLSSNSIDQYDKVLFFRIIPLTILGYFLFLFFLYHLTKPLGVILSKVEKYKQDIPFQQSLKLLYAKDEWRALGEAMDKQDQRLQSQIEDSRIENEKNTAILEAINDAIIAVDRFDSILFLNSRFEKNFIQNRPGKEIDKKVWHIFSDDVLEAFRTVLKTGKVQSLKRMNFPQGQDPSKFFDLTITPLSSSTGGITGALGVFYDVTEFKLTEQMRVDFVANVSHEIRTPLTSIKGFTQILQGQGNLVDPTLHPFLDKIVANTERMISLFNDLLNLSVIESGKNLRLEEINLEEVIESVEGNILANFPDKKVSFERRLDLKTISGDFRLIEQVIMNLCDNACKYAGEAVKIKISCALDNDRSVLIIKDDGPGISQAHLPRIFERFYRVDASRESLRGTGLGLSIVKQIITKHKGKIRAESEGPGTGTSFVIELPMV